MPRILICIFLLLSISIQSHSTQFTFDQLSDVEIKAWAYADLAQIQLMDSLHKSTIIIEVLYNHPSKNQASIEIDSVGKSRHPFLNINSVDEVLTLIESLKPDENINIFLFGPREVDPLLRKEKNHPKPVFQDISMREMRNIINSDLSQKEIDFYLLQKTILNMTKRTKSVKFKNHNPKYPATCSNLLYTD